MLHAAVRCFSEKGYAATTLVDIEVAAGLKPRCGGTYRHFKSKQAILEAVVELLLDDGEAVTTPDWSSFEQAAADGLALLDRNDDTRRLLFKDLDEFPDLKHRVGEQLIERSYGRVASSARRARPDSDSEAIAAVMVAALSGFRLHGSLLGHSPLEVSDDRFIAIWAKAFESLLEVETAGDANAS